MMGHGTMQMILQRYYSHIKNYQQDDGSAFMKNVYEPSIDCLEGTESASEISDIDKNFTPILPQAKKEADYDT